jgi:hypothetical protein
MKICLKIAMIFSIFIFIASTLLMAFYDDIPRLALLFKTCSYTMLNKVWWASLILMGLIVCTYKD